VSLCALGAPCALPPADVDGDGSVTLADLAIVQGCLGEAAPFSTGCEAADVVADGRIDVYDASRVASQLVTPAVPDVVGLSLAQAETDLVAVGLRLGTVTETPHLLVPSGAVIGATPVAGTPAAAGTPIDLLVSAPVPSETSVLGPGWQGTWAISTLYLDPQTAARRAIETGTVELCAGDPLGLSLVPASASCLGQADDAAASFTCTSSTTILGCTVELDVDFALDRNGDTFSGTGGFSLGGPASCPGVLDPDDEDVQILATRTTLAAPSCAGATVAVSQKLVRHPRLMEGLRP